jgi:hypothetical protein
VAENPYLSIYISAGQASDQCLAIRIGGTQVYFGVEGTAEIHLGEFSREAILASKSAFNEAFDRVLMEILPES